jgi:hypothetical protein
MFSASWIRYSSSQYRAGTWRGEFGRRGSRTASGQRSRWIASWKLPNRRRIVFSDGRIAASVQLSAAGSEPCSATKSRRAAIDASIRYRPRRHRLARGGHREVQIFLELGGGSPVQVDFESSIELAHGYRKADISARARLRDREGPGFENQRRSPRRCAADAQVRTVRPCHLHKGGDKHSSALAG